MAERVLDVDNGAARAGQGGRVEMAETVGVYPGEVWAWVPGEGNFRLFNTYGIGTSRVEYTAVSIAVAASNT